MKCTIFSLFISFLHVLGSCLAYTRERAQGSNARVHYEPHVYTKVQTKAQLREEAVSVHEDVKQIGLVSKLMCKLF